MRISDRYIGRQILMGTVFAILFLSVIFVLGTVLKQIQILLVVFHMPPSVIPDLILCTLPFSLIYTIPWAFLCSVLLVYGRMSRDQELTGFRVAGIGLGRLSMPVFVIGGALSALCLWLNIQIAPRAAAGVDEIKMKAFSQDPRSMIKAAVEQDGLERLESNMRGTKAHFESNDDGSSMDSLHIFRTPTPANPKDRDVYIYARKAEPIFDGENKVLKFRLYDAIFETSDDQNQPKVAVSGQAVPLVLSYQSSNEGRKKPNTMTNSQIKEYISGNDWKAKVPEKLRPDVYLRFMGEIPRRYSSSLACLAFAFVGVPLGIKARRRDTSTGLVISLLLGVAYFSTSAVNTKSMTSLLWLAWGPNLVCLLLGLYLFRRARFR